MRDNAFRILIAALLLALPAVQAHAAGSCEDGVPCIEGYTPGTGANDSKTTNPTCDGDFMNQIYARSYMESERQMVTAQSIVRKPDSVLQYTCFDKLASVTATEAGSIFSDSEDWHDTRVNIAVTGSGSGFLGQSFLDAISGFAEDLISDLLQGLLPEDLLNILSQLDSIMSLDPDQLLQSLGNMAADEISNTLNSLSLEMQMEIRDQFLNSVPREVLSMISSNPSGATAEELLLGMQGLPSNVLASVFVDIPADQLGTLLSVLPSDTLYELPPEYLSSVMAGYSSDEISVFFQSVSPEAIQSMGDGVFADVLIGLPPDARDAVFAAMDTADVIGLMSSISSDDLNQVLNGLSSDVQIALQADIVANLPPEVLNLLSDNPLTASIEELLGGLQGLDPSILADIIPGLTADAFGDLLSGLGVDQLGGLLGGGGGSAVIQLDVFMGADNLDKSIESVVLTSLKDYTDANFGHTLLGGTSDMEAEISDEVDQGGYSCTVMQDVWQLSKCGNFGGPEDPGFQDFSELAANDPRQHPQACGGTMITPEMEATASNEGGVAAENDGVEDTYVDRLGEKTDGSIVCGDPVSRGKPVLVKTVTPASGLNGGPPTVKQKWVTEKTCSNPACRYNAQSDTCVSN